MSPKKYEGFVHRSGKETYMDFQRIADSYYPSTSIISVKKTSDGGYGDIRIVTGNKRFMDFAEHPSSDSFSGADMSGKTKFVPNSPYFNYIPKNPGFEELCYRAAVLKEPSHTYVHPNKLDQWLNVFVMPIDYEEDDICYCAYTTKKADAANINISSSHSPDISDEVLKTCIKLHGTNDFKTTLSEVIQDIRILCGAEVCTIMLVDFSKGTCSVLAKSVQKNSTLKTVTQFINFYDIAVSWLDTMGENDCIIIKSEEDMKYISEINHQWWLTLDEAGVASVVMFPLQYNGEVMGFIWATNFDTRNTLRIKETLELTTFFLSSQIANYNMFKQLEHFSFTDILTGVQNRNAMNNRVSSIVSGEIYLSVPFGVVFADLNGLKAMNDTHGHSAGDIILKKAAIQIQEIFSEDEVYRAGGDEFVVIVTNCDEALFREKVKALKERTEIPDNVSIAVGCYFVSSGCDIRDAMRLADENMYKDKKEYYLRHPENDRRIPDIND